MANPNDWVFDVSEAEFEAAVIERSKQVPVVVDFWAPWCGPCRTLGPLLERLANEQAGAFLLAKVDIDQNPNLAAAVGVRSVPMVLGLRDGRVVSEFVGAVPESGVREFLARVLPSESEKAAKRGHELLAAGAQEEAERAFGEALELDSRCDGALVGMVRLLADRNEDEAALELSERVTPGTPERQEADRLAAAIRVRQAGTVDDAGLRAKIESDPDNLAARFEVGQVLAAKGQYEDALQQYLEIVRRDREFRDQAARKAILDVFELLGNGDPLVDRYRSELAKVLFS
jgi:putative thioredoxin